MARVLISTQGWGVLQDQAGNSVSGYSVTLKNRDGTNATHYSARTGGTSSTAAMTSSVYGTLDRWVEPGEYSLEVGADTYDVDAVAGAIGGASRTGTGSPEGAVAASPGATYQQTDGAEGATFWVKETGTGNTGWRLGRRMFQYDLTLLGPQPVAATAMQGGTGTSYAAPGAALSASTLTLLSGLNARVRNALLQVVWTPNATGCGIQLVKQDDGPSNIEQIYELTGNASTSPVHNIETVTSAMQTIVTDVTSQGVPTGANYKTVAYRTKGNGTVGPLIYLVRVLMLLEV